LVVEKQIFKKIHNHKAHEVPNTELHKEGTKKKELKHCTPLPTPEKSGENSFV
jgi:hypothetical protein